MTFNGTEELMQELFMEGERLRRKAPEMLGEACKVVAKAWQDVIEERGHVDTGDMRDSVRASAVKKDGDAYVSTVYPQGKDRKRQGNAEKAFVLHYGTSKIEGDRFVDEAEERSIDAVEQIMQDVWDKD